MPNKPIFFDETGRRRQRLSILGWTGAVLSTILGVAVLVSIVATQNAQSPDLPIHLKAVSAIEKKLERKAVDPALVKSAVQLAREARTREKLIQHWKQAEANRHSRPLSAALKPRADRPLTVGFYVNWDEMSFQSLKRTLPRLDWVIPSWSYVAGPNMKFRTTLDAKAMRLIRAKRPNLPILPMLQNEMNGEWYGEGLAKLLADPDRRAGLEDSIVAFLAANKLQGVVIDFEEVPENAHHHLGTFLSELSARFLPHGWIVVQAAPYDDDSWPYADYAGRIDYTMLMAYDQHEDSTSPGSVAGQPWFENTLDKRMRTLAPGRTIVAIGNYAYDWNGGDVDSLSFSEVAIAARDSHADIDFDYDTNNPHFSYIENGKIRHDIWFLDGVTAFNQVHAADVYQPAGYALWRLGSEDPTVWSVLGRRYGKPAPDALKHIPTDEEVDFEGYGEILRVEDDPAPGVRSYTIDKDSGDIVDETYNALPTNYVIRRVGLVPHKVALTFDDGPDPSWTPEILDILKEKKVPAAFFVIGANVEAHPGLVQRELAEGHEVGNHTFTHPNLAETSSEAVRLELNATQRLFEAMTGHSMHLFRPPYLGDAEPASAEEIEPVKVAQKLGYIIVGVHVDPLDWQVPTTDAMMKRIEAAVTNPNPEWRGNIIMMHDSGGDRSQTVKILPELIDRMRAKGYTFVPVSELANLTRDQAMPPIAPSFWLSVDRFVFVAISRLGSVLYYCFLAAIILGIGRLLFLAGLSFANLRRAKADEADPPDGTHIPVSVIVPAYNEEKLIAATVTRILKSDYANLEVIVIDDGSQDETATVVRKAFGADPRVTLLSEENGGKAHALNAGLARATGEVVVALDADTVFQRDTISRLTRWFSDPDMGAVAGNAKVGNRINMITRWQALEYIVAQNLERRALAALDCITVVPGAVGAWRRAAVAKLGGFPANTLAEDQDLTIAMQRAGYKVHFDASAVAWTEAPATVRGLARQRFRWAFGTLQCLWKYRAMTFNPRHRFLGLVALPQVWLFQILLTAFAPVADLLLVWQLFTQWIAYMQHGAEFTNGSLYKVALYYVVFTVVDLLGAMIGFLMEKREKWSLLWWLMLQRFGYRQIMYYVVVRSIGAAMRGGLVGWGKQERTGTVAVQTDND
jgi:cellulose synthase/poly-beta-1,6-N-acetylglucosamine synthase-like glycosyltransferase/peptidoglycan/xylan/chitin deacetylase (PgdA/CDA1 family)/spore germination protein YaaH